MIERVKFADARIRGLGGETVSVWLGVLEDDRGWKAADGVILWKRSDVSVLQVPPYVTHEVGPDGILLSGHYDMTEGEAKADFLSRVMLQHSRFWGSATVPA